MIRVLIMSLAATVLNPCKMQDTACWREQYHKTHTELVKTASTAHTYFQAAVHFEGAYDKLKAKQNTCEATLAGQNEALNQCSAKLLEKQVVTVSEVPDWYWPVAAVGLGLSFAGGTALGGGLCR